MKTPVIGIDIGSFTGKAFGFVEGAATNITTVPSLVKVITPERLDWLEEHQHVNRAEYKPGLYTLAEIGEKAAHAEDRWFQFNALAKDSPELITGVRNIIQQLELKNGLEILAKAADWTVMFAVAPKQTRAARDHLKETYISVARQFGFGGVHIMDQMSFDIFGTYPTWSQLKKDLGSELKRTLGIMNVGGGDTKFCLIADQPLPESLVTKPIGGQKVTDYSVDVIEELSSAQVTDKSEINRWLESWGGCLGHYPGEWDDGLIKEVLYNRESYPINSLLRSPEMFFQPEDPLYKLQKDFALHRMIHESIEKTKEHISIEKYLGEWLNCIVLTGGGAQFNGMAERLQSELKTLYPEHKINVRVAANAVYTCANGMIAYLKALYKQGTAIETEKYFVPLKSRAETAK